MLPVGYMLFWFGVDVLFCETEIDDVDRVLVLGAVSSDQEVLRFNIPVDEVLRMDVFDSRNLKKEKTQI